ncbi:hypothetical protein GH733_019636 [Mirounga leonina]|nr:hypothetical protein GH733_019636 [Mirounga leonina]
MFPLQELGGLGPGEQPSLLELLMPDPPHGQALTTWQTDTNCTKLLDPQAPYAELGSWSLAFPCDHPERQQPGSNVQMGQSADGSKAKFHEHSKI